MYVVPGRCLFVAKARMLWLDNTEPVDTSVLLQYALRWLACVT